MKHRQIMSRLNGLTLGPVGVSWTPKPSDKEVATRVVRFLEDRRMLYNDCASEEPEHCRLSVEEIRKMLTGELTGLKDESDLLGPLRVMRAACRKYLDQMGRVQKFQRPEERRMVLHGGWERDLFYAAIGEFRGAIGPQVALLAGYYKIDVEDELAKTLPLADAD